MEYDPNQVRIISNNPQNNSLPQPQHQQPQINPQPDQTIQSGSDSIKPVLNTDNYDIEYKSFFTRIGDFFSRIWQKTVFPDMLARKKEERLIRKEIKHEAKMEALRDLKFHMKEKMKQDEIDKLTGKSEGKGKNMLNKLAQGFGYDPNNPNQNQSGKKDIAGMMGNFGGGSSGGFGPSVDVNKHLGGFGNGGGSNQPRKQPKINPAEYLGMGSFGQQNSRDSRSNNNQQGFGTFPNVDPAKIMGMGRPNVKRSKKGRKVSVPQNTAQNKIDMMLGNR